MIDDHLLCEGRQELGIHLHGGLDAVKISCQLPFFLGLGFVQTVVQVSAQHGQNVFAQIILQESLITLGVDLLTLGVQHVVIFQCMFADVEVGAFHTFLRLFDHSGKHVVFQRDVFIEHVDALQHPFQTFPAEQTDDLVLKGEEEAGGTGVALTGGTAAQLVIDPAAFVPFGTDDMQTAQCPDLQHVFIIFNIFPDGFFIDAVFRRIHLHDGMIAFLNSHVVGILPELGKDPVGISKDVFFQFTAQLDVDTAARHVGGDGDSTEGAGFGDDHTFLVMLTGVEYLVGDAAVGSFQQTGVVFFIQTEFLQQ